MQRKSLVVTGALIIGLILGLVLSPLLSSSSADAQSLAPTAPATPKSALWNLFLDQLAATLNIQRAALDTAITDAGIRTADEALQQGTLTQKQADTLKAHIQSGKPGFFFSSPGGKPGRIHDAGLHKVMLDAVATKLNMTADELVTALRGGQTLEQLAQAKGASTEDIINAALAAAKAHLDKMVSDGKLTQKQADTLYAKLQQQGAGLLTPPKHRFGGRGHRGQHKMPGIPETPTDPDA